MKLADRRSALGLGLCVFSFGLFGCPAASSNSLGDGALGKGSGQEVSFAAADGLVVHGTVTAPSGGGSHPVVVLAHQLCSDRSEWSAAGHDWVTAFAQRGVTTLAIDLRGHGQSKAFPDGSTKDLCSGNYGTAPYAGMVSDVKAAVAYARGTLKATAVAVMGASIGSSSSLVTFAEDAQLAMAVALSPGLDYYGIKTDSAVVQIGSRPALLEAADDDGYSADSVRQLSQKNSAVMIKIWTSGGHANQILAAHPEELPRVADLVASKL